VSANPTGPLHIGHGRGAAVGSALCNILKAAGYDVQKEFYINDAGLQVKLLGCSVYARYQQKLGNNVPFPEDGYKGDYVEDIAQDIHKHEGSRYLNMPFEECGEAVTGYAYKMMRANIEGDLKDFGVVFDSWQSERDLHEQGKVESAINTLRAKDLIYEKTGPYGSALPDLKMTKTGSCASRTVNIHILHQTSAITRTSLTGDSIRLLIYGVRTIMVISADQVCS